MTHFTKAHEEVREKYQTSVRAHHLIEHMSRESIDATIQAFLEALPYFFFATSSHTGETNVNFKGLKSGTLIKVLDSKHLIFPDYKGNGIFHAIGDIQTNPKVALLCIDFNTDIRIKIAGHAKVIDTGSRLKEYATLLQNSDIPRVILVEVNYIIPNCSQQLSVVRNAILQANNS